LNGTVKSTHASSPGLGVINLADPFIQCVHGDCPYDGGPYDGDLYDGDLYDGDSYGETLP
jgi:hypothetical protein